MEGDASYRLGVEVFVLEELAQVPENEFHIGVLDHRGGNHRVASIVDCRRWYFEFLIQWSQVDVDFVGGSVHWYLSRGGRVDVEVK